MEEGQEREDGPRRRSRWRTWMETKGERQRSSIRGYREGNVLEVVLSRLLDLLNVIGRAVLASPKRRSQLMSRSRDEAKGKLTSKVISAPYFLQISFSAGRQVVMTR